MFSWLLSNRRKSKLDFTCCSIFSRFPSGLACLFICERTFKVFIVRLEDYLGTVNSTLDIWSIYDVTSFDFEYEVAELTSELVFWSNLNFRSLSTCFHGARFCNCQGIFLICHSLISSCLNLVNVLTTFRNVLEEIFVDSIDSLLQGLFFLLLKLCSISLLLVFELSITSKFSWDFKILFSLELSFKDLAHYFFFFVSGLIKRFAKLHDGNSTFRVTNGSHILVDSNGCKWAVTDFLTVSYLILTVIEIPDIKESINTGQVE